MEVKENVYFANAVLSVAIAHNVEEMKKLNLFDEINERARGGFMNYTQRPALTLEQQEVLEHHFGYECIFDVEGRSTIIKWNGKVR
jgi:hypothetical protein